MHHPSTRGPPPSWRSLQPNPFLPGMLWTQVYGSLMSLCWPPELTHTLHHPHIRPVGCPFLRSAPCLASLCAGGMPLLAWLPTEHISSLVSPAKSEMPCQVKCCWVASRDLPGCPSPLASRLQCMSVATPSPRLPIYSPSRKSPLHPQPPQPCDPVRLVAGGWSLVPLPGPEGEDMNGAPPTASLTCFP